MDGSTTIKQHMSLAEIFETRANNGNGLSANETLAILASACDFLLKRHAKTAVTDRGEAMFSRDTLFITIDGTIYIQLMPLAFAPINSIPPELRNIVSENSTATDITPVIGDAQLVWCLGNVIINNNAVGDTRYDFDDASFHSLLNLIVVEHVGTRPTLAKLSQMLRNRLVDRKIDASTLLIQLYKELSRGDNIDNSVSI